ncbi:hypothetical protein PIB30_043810, partial [Stylosanthes scabra]|nr:hypothetical protein [Stylosanthes scabra]
MSDLRFRNEPCDSQMKSLDSEGQTIQVIQSNHRHTDSYRIVRFTIWNRMIRLP